MLNVTTFCHDIHHVKTTISPFPGARSSGKSHLRPQRGSEEEEEEEEQQQNDILH